MRFNMGVLIPFKFIASRIIGGRIVTSSKASSFECMKPEELYFAESYFPFDQYVLDSYNPDTVGGTGMLCDWDKSAQLVKAIKQPILAGGLSPENVVEAVKAVNPAGVDVSSGVEFEPGKKISLRWKRSCVSARGNYGHARGTQHDGIFASGSSISSFVGICLCRTYGCASFPTN